MDQGKPAKAQPGRNDPTEQSGRGKGLKLVTANISLIGQAEVMALCDAPKTNKSVKD